MAEGRSICTKEATYVDFHTTRIDETILRVRACIHILNGGPLRQRRREQGDLQTGKAPSRIPYKKRSRSQKHVQHACRSK